MTIKQAVKGHYLETRPDLRSRDDILICGKTRIIVFLCDDHVIILSDYTTPHAFDLLIHGLCVEPITTMDKINQQRVWQYLVRYGKCRYIDYSDPQLLDIIDTALCVSVASNCNCSIAKILVEKDV